MRFHYIDSPVSNFESEHRTGPLNQQELQYLEHVKNISVCHIESVEERNDRYVDYLNVIDYEFDTMIENIASGLKGYVENKKKQMTKTGEKMVVTDLDQKQSVYHISIGTENIRISYVERDGLANTESFSIRDNINAQRITAFDLFDFISENFKDVIRSYPDENKAPNTKSKVVISTSFPSEKNGIAYLKSDWMENVHACDPIVKADLAELFNYQCKRKGIDAVCELVATDAVVALAYGDIANISPKPLMAVSLGAGLDMAYLDIQYISHSPLLPLELDPLCSMMFRSVVDQLHDFNHGASRGKRTLERMVGGDAVSDCVRLCLIKIFQGKSLKELFKPRVFSASDIYNVVNDMTDTHIVARKIMTRICTETSPDEITEFLVQSFYYVCRAVVNRVVAVLAAVVIGVAKGSGRCQEGFGTSQVILQGNVFKANPGVIQQMQQVLHEKVGNTVKVKYFREAEHAGATIIKKI